MLILVYLRGDIMINIYYTDSDNGNTKLVKDYIKGSWINMISPSEEEIKEVCDNLNIKDDFIKYSLDYEEKARIDIEDDGTMLFIVDIPEQYRKNLLALKDSDMRHVEDATVKRYAFAEIQFPTQKLERSADKASTMRRVLDADPKSDSYNKPITTFMRLYYKRK